MRDLLFYLQRDIEYRCCLLCAGLCPNDIMNSWLLSSWYSSIFNFGGERDGKFLIGAAIHTFGKYELISYEQLL